MFKKVHLLFEVILLSVNLILSSRENLIKKAYRENKNFDAILFTFLFFFILNLHLIKIAR